MLFLHSVMFWTDFGDIPKVERARMDGTSRTSIISRLSPNFQNLQHPNDVVVDMNTDILYFCDAAAGIIGAATLVGNSGEVIVQHRDNPGLRRSQSPNSLIREPWSLTLRHFAAGDRDSNPNTEQTELFWSDPEFHMMSSATLITTGRVTSGIEKDHLRNILERLTLYKPLAIQFVVIDGHKPSGIYIL